MNELDFMKPDDLIFVAGHQGLVGSSIYRALVGAGYHNLLTRNRQELDLSVPPAVTDFFQAFKPRFVFLAAAKVGGILANERFPAEFLDANLAIQTNVICGAREAGTERLLFLGSSCIYPKHAAQPISEEAFMTGPLEPTNRSYAIAKIAGIEMCWSSNRQYGTRYMSAMPTNLYGPGDNYDLQKSHVLPALLRKAAEAKRDRKLELAIWGTGTPRREFLHSDDLAAACLFLMNLDNDKYSELIRSDHPPIINIGTGEDITIAALASLVCEIVGFEGKLNFDTSKPDGTPRKLMNISRMAALGWRPCIPLREGICKVWDSVSYLFSEDPTRTVG